jgi:hypothetical protein
MAKRQPGKYDAVLQGKPLIPLESNPTRQMEIDQLKEKVKELPAIDLAMQYAVVRARRDLLRLQESVLQLELDALTQLLIESEDVKNDPAWGAYGANDNAIRLPNGSTLRINREPASTVVDPEKFRLWCIANGYERKLQLHAGTRESIVAERMLAAEPAPDGLEVGTWSKLTFTAAKTGD